MWTTVSRMDVWCVANFNMETQFTVYTDLWTTSWVVWATVEERCGWVDGCGEKGSSSKVAVIRMYKETVPASHPLWRPPRSPFFLFILPSSYFILQFLFFTSYLDSQKIFSFYPILPNFSERQLPLFLAPFFHPFQIIPNFLSHLFIGIYQELYISFHSPVPSYLLHIITNVSSSHFFSLPPVPASSTVGDKNFNHIAKFKVMEWMNLRTIWVSVPSCIIYLDFCRDSFKCG